MKNLRKVLAVVLVVAMAFSFAAVASAKQIQDYTDASSVKYTEAVDLVTGLGIMTGAGGTTFDPTGTFTREQAAKVICYMMLGTAVASNLTMSVSTFKDVEATRWSAPFIAYCAANGIIGGDGTGNFNPTAPITGSQMAKLILCALGYGAKGEYTGSSWEINSIVKAQSINILTTNVNYTAPATRQEVAQYVFNALTRCYYVTYNPVLGQYDNALPSTIPSPTPTYMGTYSDWTQGYSSFKLEVKAANQSYGGLTAHYWQMNVTTTPTTVSGTYSDDNVIYSNAGGFPFNMSNVIASNSGFYKVSLDSAKLAPSIGIPVYINGQLRETITSSTPWYVASATVPLTFDPSKDGTTAPTSCVQYYTDSSTGNYAAGFAASNVTGNVVKYLDNDKNGLVDAVYIYSYSVSTLSTAPSVDAAGNVTLSGSGSGLSKVWTKDTVVYPAGLAANDKCTFIIWNGTTGIGNLYIQKATMVTGQVTSQGITYTLGGKAYSKAGYTGNSIMSSGSGTQNVDATAWIDSNGIMFYCQLAGAASYNYGLAISYYYSTAGVSKTAQVQLMKNDGTIGVYTIAPDGNGVTPNQTSVGTGGNGDFVGATINANYTTATLVSYSFNAAGQVTVSRANTAANGTATGYQKGSPNLPVTGIQAITYSGTPSVLTLGTASAASYYITPSTKVFIYDNTLDFGNSNKPALLTGYSAIPAEASAGVQVVTDTQSPSTLVALYLNVDKDTSGNSVPTGTSGNYVYFTSGSYTLRVVNGVNYYDYSGFVNGATTKTTLTSTTSLSPSKVLYAYTTDSTGNVTSISSAAPVVNVTQTALTTSNYKVTYVSPDGSYIAYTDLGASPNEYKVLQTNANTKYIQIVNANSGVLAAAPIVASATGSTVSLFSYVTDANSTNNVALYVYYCMS